MERTSPLAVLAKHQTAPPIDLWAIASDLGLNVEEVPLSSNVSGKIMRDPVRGGSSGFLIQVNVFDPARRRRFTLAHEIAHFILHRDLIEKGVVDDTMYRSNLSSRYETQANQLAADILMPRRLVNSARGEYGDNVAVLAAKFNVSEQAMSIRLGDGA